ncbi:MAG: diguanylate cyclase [Rhodoferax sp.]|uniref:diguanylate cyclase domain-containing protein n=1 Tax=Rhodoferax sp. TaxID=50421 RepID=UPI00261D600C|nr:diguanylate cyclase [Rhodoferax sp.]MDD5334607.1 diguanylate cyclase [Rhodoferax sp.]
MKLRSQIFSGYILLAMLVLLVGLTGYLSLNAIAEDFDGAINRTQPVLRALNRIRFLATRQAFSVASELIPDRAAHAGEASDKKVEPSVAALMAATSEYRALVEQYFPDELTTVKAVEQAVKDFGRAVEQLDRYGDALDDRAFHVQLAQVRVGLKSLLDLVAEAAADEETEFQKHQASVGSELRRHLTLLLGACVLSILAAIGGGALFARRIAQPINVLRLAALRLGSGHLESRAEVQSKNEIGELAQTFNQMASDLSSTLVTRDYVELILESLTDGVIVVDKAGRIVRCNSAMQQIWNSVITGPILSRALGEVFANEAIGQALAGDPRTPQSFESSLRGESNPGIIVKVSVSQVMPGSPNDERVLLVKDITAQKRMEEQVRQLAFYDPLTKLPNRRMLNDRLSQTMAASQRSGRYGALMFLDLDNFKPINDTLGHGAGDLVLMEVARRLLSCVRQRDTVARFGGDEFVVMLAEFDGDQAKSTLQAQAIAEKIRALLAQPYSLTLKKEGQTEFTMEYGCTASFGVVLFVGHQASEEEVLKWADTAMYRAKDAGTNSICLYEG